jgi:hypothetical protein
MMFQPWQCTLHVARHQATLLVTNAPHDLLKAQLDSHPSHPRALLTLLEGLSLWQGEPLRVGSGNPSGQRRCLDSSSSRLPLDPVPASKSP